MQKSYKESLKKNELQLQSSIENLQYKEKELYDLISKS